MVSRPSFLPLALVSLLVLFCLMAGCSARREALTSPATVASHPGSIPSIVFAFTPLSTRLATSEPTSPSAGALGSSTAVRISPTPLPVKTVTLPATPDPAACVPVNSQVDYGLVKWVTGGDTLVVDIRGQLRSVRYIGLDAPVSGRNPAGQYTDLVLNRVVRLVRDVSEVDRFGQLLRYVFVDNSFINYELVRQGLASTIKNPPDLACAGTFRQAEVEARSQGLGIWAEVAIVLPTPTQLLFTTTLQSTLTPAGVTLTGVPTSTQLASSTQPSSTIRPSSTISPQTTLTQGQPQPTSSPTQTPGQPTATFAPTHTGEYTPDLRITNIFYEGTPPAESDEYFEIANYESFPVNLQGWLVDTGETGLTLELTDFLLMPNRSCRIYTNMMRTDSCGISFQSPQPVWDNEDDCGFLSAPNNWDLIDFYCYPEE